LDLLALFAAHHGVQFKGELRFNRLLPLRTSFEVDAFD
jgi:hypothetical protein